MRVTLVTGKYPPEYSGAGLRTHNSYRRIINRNQDVKLQVLCSGLEYQQSLDYEHDGIPVHRISGYMDNKQGRLLQVFSAYAEAMQILKYLYQNQTDLIHVVGSSSVTAAAISYARLNGTPLLIEVVNAGASPRQSLPGLHHFWRVDLQKGTAIITISDDLAKHCKDLGLNKIVWSRPNPVDITRFTPEPEQQAILRSRMTPFTKDDVVLTTVAKFMPRKNQIFLLEVLALLPQKYKLLLAGPVVESGPLRERDHKYLAQIRTRILDLNLQHRVHLVTAFVSSEDYIRLSDIYLLPHCNEGLGTPMLESLACAVPVVANRDEAAFRQWIDEGVNGFLASMDALEWSVAIQKTEKISSSQRLAAARHIHDVASYETIDTQFLSLINALRNNPVDRPFYVSDIQEYKT